MKGDINTRILSRNWTNAYTNDDPSGHEKSKALRKCYRTLPAGEPDLGHYEVWCGCERDNELWDGDHRDN